MSTDSRRAIIGSVDIELRTTPHGGRSFFAACDIPPGTRILSSPSPFAHVVYRDYRREVCTQCFVYSAGDLAVARSRVWDVKWSPDGPGASAAWFCSEDCKKIWEQDRTGPLRMQIDAILTKAQAASCRKGKASNLALPSLCPEAPITQDAIDQAWKDVEALASSQALLSAYCATLGLEDMELEIARSLASAIVCRYVSERLDDTTTDEDVDMHSSWPHLLRLQNNELANVRARPYILSAHLRVYAFLCNALPKYLKPYMSTVREVLARDTGNAFGIWDGDRRDEMFGWGIWTSASYFNHNCAPNVRKVRHARALHFETSRAVSAGEELCISYVDTDQPVEQRRGDLETSWFFRCSCDRCERESSAGNCLALEG
ncbi:hypothetical protein ID866_9737 [Astraeus odoratus]|nr:hypothetical protein ID866_9737 [Astraeus odoratus]